MQRRQAHSVQATPEVFYWYTASALIVAQVLMSKENISNAPRKKFPMKRRKEDSGATSRTQTSVTQYRPIPGIHYHLNMKDVPFVVGTVSTSNHAPSFCTSFFFKSTSPSHSLSANYQHVLSLMKYHNPVLCGAAAVNIVSGTKTTKKKAPKKVQKEPREGPSAKELQGLLDALEGEFGQLT